MNTLVSAVIALVLVLSQVHIAQAEVSPARHSYFALKGGVFQPNEEAPGLKNFDDGYNFEGAFGGRLNNFLALEVAVGGYGADIKETIYTDISATNARIVVVPVTVSAVAILPINIVDLFAGVGGGYYYARLRTATATNAGTYEQDFDAGTVGFLVLGGVDINVSDRFAIGAEVKHHWAKPEFDIVGTKEKLEVGGTVINGAIKVRF